MRRVFYTGIVLLLAISLAAAETTALTPQLQHLRAEGFEALYNMDYDSAETKFTEMTRTDPKHPAGYIYLAGSAWLHYLFKLRRVQTALYNRNNSFFTKSINEVDPAVDKEFQDKTAKAIQLCQERIKANKNDVYALYFLGIAKGAIAGYETTIKRSFFSSLRNGANAVELHREVLKKDPHFTDAYLSIGMYDYVVGSLPLAVKILAFLGGVHGSKNQGIQELERVLKEGRYANVEAAVILVVLYDREKRLADSLKVLQDLTDKFPRNCVFQLETAQTLERLHRLPESFQLFESLLQDRAATDYMGDLIHYQYADALFESKSWEKAYSHYIVASSMPTAPESLITMARLGAGKCLDAMGKHELAQSEYQLVLRRPEAFDSHDEAKSYLKKPYAP